MKIIKIAFYKHSKTIFWKWIRVKQRLQWYAERYARYSHTELVFEDWLFFSSSEVDWWVRFKKIKPKKRNWDFIEIEVSDKHYEDILKFCKSQDWNKYNTLWIVLAQICNLNTKKDNQWFCSEITSRALQEAKMLCPYSSLFINPARLANLLENEWFLIK